MPETNLIFPDPQEDLLMAAFGQGITDLLIALGVPVEAESLARAAIINRTLIAGGSFDMYILDWKFPLYPGYLCELFYSESDTLLTGGYNTTGYNRPAFDDLCKLFWEESDSHLAQAQAYQLQSLLAEDLPYIPLYHPQVFDIIREDVILPYVPKFRGIVGVSGFQTDVRILIK
jgi:ABC-type transport system substrate-binding protein